MPYFFTYKLPLNKSLVQVLPRSIFSRLEYFHTFRPFFHESMYWWVKRSDPIFWFSKLFYLDWSLQWNLNFLYRCWLKWPSTVFSSILSFSKKWTIIENHILAATCSSYARYCDTFGSFFKLSKAEKKDNFSRNSWMKFFCRNRKKKAYRI